MLDNQALRALIPHAGSMCLLDRVEEWNQTQIRCSARSHRDPSHPLRAHGGLSAVHLIEYAAQAMAVHGALLASTGPQPGMLGALRDIRLYVTRLDDLTQPLIVIARRRLARSDGLIYDFDVTLQDLPERVLGEGRISVVLSNE